MDSPGKDQWRRRARAARERPPIDHDAHVAALAEFVLERRTSASAGGSRSGYVVGYHAMGFELDLSPLMDRSDLGPFAVTRTPDEGLDLTVHPHGTELERHRYGFDQPRASAPTVDDAAIDVVLVPGLAFDRSGARLGHGAGYYDRLLTRLLEARPDANPNPDGGLELLAIVGITGGYIVAELPVESHDVPMTHLCGAFGVLPTPLADPIG